METMPHPSLGVLTAFAEGRLTPALLSDIEGHLASCASCRATLKAIPPGGLESLVREAVAARPVSSETVVDQASCLPVGLGNHPRYRVTGVIGAGGMGTVYRAEHRLMKRAVAVKVIGSDWSQRPNLVARFCREIEAVAKLSHPNIATAFDAEQVGGALVLVTELIDGHDLAQEVTRRGALPVIEACDYARQTANGLQHAHERGIVHRDIKPSNLMLTPGGVVRILDFGLAALGGASDAADLTPVSGSTRTGGSITDYGERCGTPDYMAPEQGRDAHTADARADVYSLGRTLRFLLTGDVAGDLAARRDVPAALVAVVSKMTDPDPVNRYATAAQVEEALTPFVTERRSRRWWLLAVLVTVAGGSAGALIWSRTRLLPEMPPAYWHFARPTDTVMLPRRVELDRTCTIEARVMLTTDDAKDWCVFCQWESGKEDLYLGVSPGGISGCCHPLANVDARCRVTLNEWHHVAFVCDEKQARLYLDGKLMGAAAVTKGKIGKGTGLPTIGAVWRPPEQPRGSFIGNMHWLRVSNIARYGDSFEPLVHAPKMDVTTLLSFPGEASQKGSRPAAGFVGATGPEPNNQTK
jgi:hypothetical protein